MAYRPTIGLEIHAELRTKTKMFCSCKNDPDETRPNVNVCPVCMAHPGTLPVPNREAVKHVLRVGAAIGGKLATEFSEWDRKSYFYPDIPKGYQISQYEHPLVSGGELAGVAITRVHLEEDTASSSHAHGKSLVDFNRAGVPLMELVTEPVIHDAATAGTFARELQLLLRTIGAGEANLEKGQMRIEVNISVSKEEGVFGTKVEIKNLNSFRSVERAIEFEVQRQIDALEKGEAIKQSTRGWSEEKQETFHQRVKEGSADYRYFPEPDLPKLVLNEVSDLTRDALKATLPELPNEKRARFEALGIKKENVEVLMQDEVLRELFEQISEDAKDDAELMRLSANYLLTDIAALEKASTEMVSKLTASAFSKTMRMIKAGTLSSRGAKDLLAILYREGGDPEQVAKDKGLVQVHDEAALGSAVDAVLAEEAKAVEEYRGGKEAALQYLVGKSMKATKGAGNPGLLREIIVKKLS